MARHAAPQRCLPQSRPCGPGTKPVCRQDRIKSEHSANPDHGNASRSGHLGEGFGTDLPLNRVALAALGDQRKLVPHKPNSLVFPNAGDYCRFWFEPSVAAAKISEYTWHNNRHTFCSWLAMAGVSIQEIQELSGHKTITMEARYSHLAPDTVASASERIVTAGTGAKQASGKCGDEHAPKQARD